MANFGTGYLIRIGDKFLILPEFCFFGVEIRGKWQT